MSDSDQIRRTRELAHEVFTLRIKEHEDMRKSAIARLWTVLILVITISLPGVGYVFANAVSISHIEGQIELMIENQREIKTTLGNHMMKSHASGTLRRWDSDTQ